MKKYRKFDVRGIESIMERHLVWLKNEEVMEVHTYQYVRTYRKHVLLDPSENEFEK